MPSAVTLTAQIELAKTKINALSASTLTTQDLVFLAKSLESLGSLLGVNDIVALTNEKISEITNASSGQVTTITNAGSSQVNAVVTSGNQQIALVNAAVDNYNLFVNMGVI